MTSSNDVIIDDVVNAIPEEYREAAKSLFLTESSVDVVERFAECLGIGGDYKKLIAIESADHIRQYLTCFQNNLDLLIQKTWVEKTDSARKEHLQDRVPDLIAEIEQGNFKKALTDFNIILSELAYLFFGNQSRKEDFTEYTFRIDAQMGLFWWYGYQLNLLQHANNDYLRALLLLGICYLSNF
jgi:hypothetical protein